MFIISCKKACAEVNRCRPLLTSGMANAEKVSFAFDAEWNGLTKTAVFTDGAVSVDVLQANWQGNTVPIPHEVLTEAGRTVRVGVYGTNADSVALPTIWATLGKVRAGADPSGDEAADPTLPIWAQLQAQIGDLDNLTTKAKANLVAAINEAAKTGSGGAGSIDMQVSGGYIQYSNDGGTTWENLIAVDDLKGKPGEDGAPGTPGEDGKTGADGYSPVAKVEATADGAKITITDKSGTTEAAVKNGKDGADGAPGKDGTDGTNGITPTIGDNGNWYLGTEDTGKPSRGEPGADAEGLPSVTASDNGKFLRVVNGAWAAAEIQNANGEEF